MGDPPSDIWEQPEAKCQMRNMNFRFINMYRMTTMYMMTKRNPYLLKPKPKKIPANERAIRERPKVKVPRVSKEEVERYSDPDARKEAQAEIAELKR